MYIPLQKRIDIVDMGICKIPFEKSRPRQHYIPLEVRVRRLMRQRKKLTSISLNISYMK